VVGMAGPKAFSYAIEHPMHHLGCLAKDDHFRVRECALEPDRVREARALCVRLDIDAMPAVRSEACEGFLFSRIHPLTGSCLVSLVLVFRSSF
jgi:hypothetical protein